jgi:hypothetical protein
VHDWGDCTSPDWWQCPARVAIFSTVHQGREIIVLHKNCHIFNKFLHKIHIFHIAFHRRAPQSPKFCGPNVLKGNAAQNSRNFIQYFGNLLAPTAI